MRVRILFITSEYFHLPTVRALQRMDLECDTTVVPYSSFAQIPEIYRQHQDHCDAVFLSGISARQYLELHCPGITIPVEAFQVDSDALHRDILRMAVENQSLDFSRIAMDFLLPLENIYSVMDFLEIDDIQTVFSRNVHWIQEDAVDSAGAEALILERILELWDRGAIDRVICMYSSNIPRLQAMGIPFRCPFLSDAHLLRLIKDVLVRIELNHLHNNHPSTIQVFPLHAGSLTPKQRSALEQHVRAFLKTNLIDCVVQCVDQCCIVMTSMQVLRYLTDEFRVCRISAYLSDKLDFPFSVGYGIGTTISHAMNNVQVASREAVLMGKPFVMDTNGNLIGPLSSDGHMVIAPSALQEVSGLAKRCSLSSMTIRKIQAIVQINGSDKLTIQELAARLDTTIRNANRIMTNLQKGGVATPVYSQVTHSRGRPVQVYTLNFHSPVPQ